MDMDMKTWFSQFFPHATSLGEFQTAMVPALRKLSKRHGGLVYVAGIITSDGPEYIERNAGLLIQRTIAIRPLIPGVLVFSACDLFTDYNSALINAPFLPSAMWIDFFNTILEHGGVTRVIFTPRWEKSTGAQAEHSKTTELNLAISYWEDLLYPLG